MKTPLAFVASALSIWLCSCSKTISVTPPAYAEKRSIQCMLEPDSIPVLYYNKTVPYFDKQINFGDLVIRNAVVKIQSPSGTDNLRLDSAFDRLTCQYNYFYKGSFPAQLNQTYTLTITDGSNSFTATANTALAPPVVDSASYTPKFNDLYGEHEGVIVYFKDVAGQTNYYRFQMLRYIDTTTKQANSSSLISACLGADSLLVRELGRSVYSDQGLDGQHLKIIIEPAYSHKAGVKGRIAMQAIDANAYAFFEQLDRQKLAQYNPFVEPVFLKPGQFGTKAIGYFSAMVKSNAVAFVFPE